jgi:hypothetical protein
MKLPSFALTLLLLVSGNLHAQQMSYQGRLTDASGAAKPGPNATITFSLWDEQTDTETDTKVWGDFLLNVDLIDGRFSVKLGDAAGNDANGNFLKDEFGGPRYLELTVGTDSPLPRQEVLYSPKAFHSIESDHALLADEATHATNADLATNAANAANAATAGHATTATAIGNPAGGTAPITVDFPNERVGVGTSTPQATLHVKGDSVTPALEVNVNGARALYVDPNSGVNIGSGNTTPPVAGLYVSGELVVNSGISSTGKVGIGTSSPETKLHVVGGEDASLTKHGYIVSGPVTGPNLVIDDDEIVARNNGATSQLYLQKDGGNLKVGNSTSTTTLNGKVGIGTTNPQVKLDVVGSNYITMVDNRYDSNNFSSTGSTYTWVGQVHGSGRGVEVYGMDGSYGLAPDYNVLAPLGIRSDGWIASAMGIVVYSDRRIKRDMQASPKVKDLAAIQQLQVTDYRMVDPGDGGMAWRKGFIAQEVEKVMPLAVSRSTEFVPDIFSVATAVAYDPAVKTLTLTLAKDHGLKSGDRVRLHIDGKREDLNVSAVPSAREFVMEQCENKPEKVLVYGKQVSDFRTVNYDHIFTTSVGAVQELARKVETQELECTELRESNVALRSRVAALEAKDRIRDTKIASIEKLLNSINPPSTRTISLKSE